MFANGAPCYWIVFVFFYGLFQFASTAHLRCYKTSRSNYTDIDLNNPEEFLNSTCYDHELPTICYTFGYRGKIDGPATTSVLDAYLENKKRNVLVFDWEEEAKSGLLGIKIGYVLFAVPNAKQVGWRLGRALVKLAKAGLSMNKMHLMGHSLGAHVMGHAGRWARENGHPVSRITGLDPARALYEGIPTLQKGLDRTCAKFVDIIHTNPGNYGTKYPSGTVDFWPNFGNKGLQPGCPEGNYPMFSSEDLCSHNRAWEYYIESLQSPTAFPAAGAENYDAYLESEGCTNNTIYMGQLANPRASGNYYLTTNDRKPFGKGEEGLYPSNQARRRRTTYTSTLIKFTGVFR